MIESSKKFVVFDIRVANVDSEIFDEKFVGPTTAVKVQ